MLPSACLTWFQAAQACALSGKRLVTNREWQRAAAGTPDPPSSFDDGTTECNVGTAGVPVNTGSRSSCKSSWGAFDMVGNVTEWVEDWADRAGGCTDDWTTETGFAGGDRGCFGGGGTGVPGALIRGGSWGTGSIGGVFAVDSFSYPSQSAAGIGFRCAR